MQNTFPKGFVWGAAAASYQIEGGWDADGKGLSVWDWMCEWPGKIDNGDTGKVACDHYHRHAEDVAMMGDLELQAYRLSISWPRVLPQGVGAANAAGLDFYDRLIDALLAKGIQPWVTLFHWDFPYELYKRGGWLNRDSADWFAEYTALIAGRFGDRVRHWMTQNEPVCFLELGHKVGRHAPGVQLDMKDVLLASHHSLLAHGKSVQALRAGCSGDILIGAAPTGRIGIAATDSPEDVEAARRYTFGFDGDSLWILSWFTDPMILGHYPEEGMVAFAGKVPEIGAQDMATICQPLDFFGFNCYLGRTVKALDNAAGYVELPHPIGGPRTAMDWAVTPQALNYGPRFLYDRYQLPIVVTENGLANTDWPALDGKVYDYQRIDFLNRYLRAFHQAIQSGVPALGYFQWSIMDNFEWAEGYRKRFGLVYVDYETQQRIPKESAYWYREVIRSHGAHLYAGK